MISVVLFIFGLCVGSFLNVVALRYDGEHFVFDPKIIGSPRTKPGESGSDRSRCPHCGKVLHWYELVPIVSFVVQEGKCRGCKAKIGWHYPAVELVTGLIFVAVPWRLVPGPWSLIPCASSLIHVPCPMSLVPGLWFLALLWILAFLFLLLISYIDILLGIIPDELEIMLGISALGIVALESIGNWKLGIGNSFLGPYASVFGFQQNLWTSHLIGAVAAFAFFELLVLITRGRGMGMGDVKLALPLGFLFGWPDIIVAVMAAFILGAIAGGSGILLGKKTMRATLPFGPFLAAGAAFIFFFGLPVAQWYFGLMGA